MGDRRPRCKRKAAGLDGCVAGSAAFGATVSIRKWRREPEPEPYRETDAMRARRQAAEHEAAWNAWFDTRLDQRLSDERNVICEIVAEALGQALDNERQDAGHQPHETVKTLRTEVAELSTIVSELRQDIACERASVVDLPPLPRIGRAN